MVLGPERVGPGRADEPVRRLKRVADRLRLGAAGPLDRVDHQPERVMRIAAEG